MFFFEFETFSVAVQPLMCYQCENCTAKRPPTTHQVECIDKESKTGLGVCFIQRVGDKYNRGCATGFNCIETKSKLYSNYCCDKHNFCNDEIPEEFNDEVPESKEAKADSSATIATISAMLPLAMCLVSWILV